MPKLAQRAWKRRDWGPETLILLVIHQPVAGGCSCPFDGNDALLRSAWQHWRPRIMERYAEGVALPETFWEVEGPAPLRAGPELYSASGEAWSEVLLRREALERERSEWLHGHPPT